MIEKAIAGLHDAAYGAFGLRAPQGTRVLDLGAGSGAWAHRLKSQGHSVTAVDYDAASFAAAGIPLVTADLNQDFASRLLELSPAGPYPAITSLEVIEHLENPRHFLRECRKLLAPEGFILLTTPNIECVTGRLKFLATGQLRMFGRDPRYNDLTHITPIHSYLFEKISADCGLRIEYHGFNRPNSHATNPGYRLVSALLAPWLSGLQGGDNHLFVLRMREGGNQNSFPPSQNHPTG